MLIEFSVANFRSIKDRITLSLVASSDSSLPGNCFPIAGESKLQLLKGAAIYGANASGKSNLVKALALMRDLVLNSASTGQRGKPIPVVPFKLDPVLASQPTEMEVVFALNGKRYIYGFSATQERVLEEWLNEVEVKPRALFSRTVDGEVSFGGYWKGPKKRLKGLVRPNALFLSVAVQFESEMAKPVFDWFKEKLTIVNAAELSQSIASRTVERLDSEPEFSQRLSQLMRVADLGISRLDLSRREVEEAEVPEEVRQQFLSSLPVAAGAQGVETRYEQLTIQSYHATQSGGEVLFEFAEESDGTHRYFALAGPWLHAIESEGVLVVDELERSLHPLLMRHLIEGMHASPRSQLIFTTHNDGLLDDGSALLRRDQIWLIEKNTEAASQLRSLWDFHRRKDENFRRGYLSGRYGATPVIGAN